MPDQRFRLQDALDRLPAQSADQLRFVTLWQRGSLSLELYAPQGHDAQTPHTQDELYVVMAGHGEFVNGAERHPFAVGDVLFAPAGVEHRFEHFSADFVTWVIFAGPAGGELVEENAPSTTPSKAELRMRMDAGLVAFLQALDRFDAAQLSGPTDAAGWTLCDHVVHLAVWAEGIAALLRHEPRWPAMGLQIDAYAEEETDYDLLNAAIRQQNLNTPATAARQRLIAAHEQVIAAIGALDDNELGLPYARFVAPFTGDDGDLIWHYIAGNTFEHYAEHLPWMWAILASRASGPL
ncbi:ClbS/DfsB family four-helix bundle protein [Candidatus Gracilibacteria bacterium]|nr:ClbS/DfsB family four-helix bundle protein [Candidatus Gracilibacteria bacterium]